MKYSKAGILKKKIGPASDILQEEAKRMEEKLSELKEFMMKEKEKRDTGPKMKDGSKWRSAMTSKPISGYADLVLTQKPKVQTKRPQVKKEEFLPTSVLLGIVEEKPSPVAVQKDEVLEFLKNCGLEKYHKMFVENGIEEIEILMELTESHMANMNIPLGHRLKILKKIKEIKGKENNYQAEPLQSEVPKPAHKSQTTETAVGDDMELGHGEFNEKESYDMFKEAIEQFRNSGSPTKHKLKTNKSNKQVKFTEDNSKKVRFLEPVTEEMLPKEIKGMLYEGTWEPDNAAIPETFEESSGTNAAVLISERKSCWNCYKIFSADLVYKAYEKEFCSSGCAKVYFNSRAVVCHCGKEFIKSEGRIAGGEWVCCEKCVREDVREEKVEEIDEEEEEEDEEDFIRIDPVTGDPLPR